MSISNRASRPRSDFGGRVTRRHARDVNVICQTPGGHVIFFLVTPKVRKAEELPGLKWDHDLPVFDWPEGLVFLVEACCRE